MRAIRISVMVGNLKTGVTETITAEVHDHDTFSTMPASLLRRLGIEPVATAKFRATGGDIVERETGYATFATEKREGYARVVFGAEGEYRIGMTTLGDLGLEVDTAASKLVPVDWLLPSLWPAGLYEPEREERTEIAGNDVAAAGRKIYEGIREEMEANHWGELVVIDVHSGDYEVGEYKGPRSDMEITGRLRERRPDAHTWAELVGKERYSFAKFGWRGTMAYLASQRRQPDD